ncbi:hypothetical protein QFZ50_001158 [Arthrobacter agilis]|nr:hypothetical protein [Arthrobacter agilis]
MTLPSSFDQESTRSQQALESPEQGGTAPAEDLLRFPTAATSATSGDPNLSLPEDPELSYSVLEDRQVRLRAAITGLKVMEVHLHHARF